MRKKTIKILFIISTCLILPTIGAEGLFMAWALQCDPSNGVCGAPSPIAFLGLGLAVLCGLASSILLLIAEIGALIKQAKQQQWGWFVCTILFSWITLLIYLIVVPEMEQPAVAMLQYQAYAPGMPMYQQPYAPGAQPYQPYPYPPQPQGEMQPPPSQG